MVSTFKPNGPRPFATKATSISRIQTAVLRSVFFSATTSLRITLVFPKESHRYRNQGQRDRPLPTDRLVIDENRGDCRDTGREIDGQPTGRDIAMPDARLECQNRDRSADPERKGESGNATRSIPPRRPDGQRNGHKYQRPSVEQRIHRARPALERIGELMKHTQAAESKQREDGIQITLHHIQ